MDIWAFVQIEKLEELAKANGIDVPRLRGYRWMGDQTIETEKDIAEQLDRFTKSEYAWMESYAEKLLENIVSRVNAEYEQSEEFDVEAWKRSRDFNIDSALNDLQHHWSDIHSYPSRYKKQTDMWNRYCGCHDVLLIHSRIGSGAYKLKDQPWFLDYVLDAYDPTYCDIYAKLTVIPDGLKAEDKE